jgi:D-ribose pyranose/furanose isomerase RbsD
VDRFHGSAMALAKNLPPAIIRQENKRFYYSYLNKAQQTQNMVEIKKYPLEDLKKMSTHELMMIINRVGELLSRKE